MTTPTNSEVLLPALEIITNKLLKANKSPVILSWDDAEIIKSALACWAHPTPPERHRCVRCGRTSDVVRLNEGCPFCDKYTPPSDGADANTTKGQESLSVGRRQASALPDGGMSAEPLFKVIEDAISEYRLSNFRDDEGYGFPITDAFAYAFGNETIKEALEELEQLVDFICGALIEPIKARDAKLSQAKGEGGGVLVPKELTAENGAKYELIGDFYFDVSFMGVNGDEEILEAIVPWTTIKEIHRAVVKLFSAPQASEGESDA